MKKVSAMAMDKRSRLRRSRDREGVLSASARSALADNTQKNCCERCRRERAGV